MELHILFFILAGLLIALLVGYSVWSARREKSRVFEASGTFSNPARVQPAREVPPSQGTRAPETMQTSEEVYAQTIARDVERSIDEIKISLPGQEPPVSAPQAAPLYGNYDPQPEPQAVYEQPQEPLNVQIAHEEETAQAQCEAPSDIFSVYVVAAENEQFRGDVLVQHLENLGLRFGEYQIYHRYVEDENSPVVFSVANMLNPGSFDLSQLAQFETIGVVFFMHTPSAMNDLANLRIMLRSAETLAERLNGFVLDDQHQIFDDYSRQRYQARLQA